MGIYDTYGAGHQVKINGTFSYYEIGENCPLPDGIYITREGAIVVIGGKFIAEFEYVCDKWGNPLDSTLLLRDTDEISNALKPHHKE